MTTTENVHLTTNFNSYKLTSRNWLKTVIKVDVTIITINVVVFETYHNVSQLEFFNSTEIELINSTEIKFFSSTEIELINLVEIEFINSTEIEFVSSIEIEFESSSIVDLKQTIFTDIIVYGETSMMQTQITNVIAIYLNI